MDFKGLGLTDYPDIVKEPRDLGTIKQMIENGTYKDVDTVVKDIRLVLEKQWDIRVPNVTGEKPPPPSSRPPYSRPPAGLQVLGSQRSRRAEKAQDKALGADGHGPGKAARGGDEGGEAAAGVEGGPESRGRSVSPPPPGKRQRSNQSKP